MNFLNTCVLNLSTDYVFEYLVMDYNNAPSKKKAIALYEVFLGLNATHEVNCNELLGPTARIHRLIDFYRESSQMNILQRIVLKGLRAADKNIFDHFLPAIFRQEDNVTMAGHLANASTQQASKSNSSIGRSWAPAKRKLIDAGFACIACT